MVTGDLEKGGGGGVDAVRKYLGVLCPVNHCGYISVKQLCYHTLNVDAETHILMSKSSSMEAGVGK